MNAVTVANEHVGLVEVTTLIGMETPRELLPGGSIKVRCPFGEFYHADGGHSAAMRLYADTNSAFCFAGCGYYSVVKLYAHAKDLEPNEAAMELLEKTKKLGLLQDRGAWDRVSQPLDSGVPSSSDLAAALKLYCSRIHPQWDEVQFYEGVSDMLAQCLGLLSNVVTDQDAQNWLRKTKTAMQFILERT
jgi:hypothetical protein